MTFLVIGGSGSVGGHILGELSAKGCETRCMTRVADNFKSFPPGIQGCIGDLEKPATLRMAFDGVKRVFLMTPLHPMESKLGLAAVKAATNAKVQQIVYMTEPKTSHSEHIPHFKRKRAIEQAIVDSGIPYVFLRPNNFFQNDYWCEAAIMLYHVYPQPLGDKGINRVDARDVGDAAVNALLTDEFNGQSFNINGPDTLTGESIAATFSELLGETVAYSGDDLAAWAKQARHMMPEWMVSDFKILFQYYQDHGAVASEQDLIEEQKILQKSPRNFRDFVTEIIPQWRSEHHKS